MHPTTYLVGCFIQKRLGRQKRNTFNGHMSDVWRYFSWGHGSKIQQLDEICLLVHFSKTFLTSLKGHISATKSRILPDHTIGVLKTTRRVLAGGALVTKIRFPFQVFQPRESPNSKATAKMSQKGYRSNEQIQRLERDELSGDCAPRGTSQRRSW